MAGQGAGAAGSDVGAVVPGVPVPAKGSAASEDGRQVDDVGRRGFLDRGGRRPEAGEIGDSTPAGVSRSLLHPASTSIDAATTAALINVFTLFHPVPSGRRPPKP